VVEAGVRLERELDLAFDLPARLALINATVYSGDGALRLRRSSPSRRTTSARDPSCTSTSTSATQMSMMSTWLGDRAAAERRALRAVTLARQSRNPSSLAYALWALGTAIEEDDPLRAESLLGTALETARERAQRMGHRARADVARLAASAGQFADRCRSAAARPARSPVAAGHRSHLWATIRLCSLVAGDLGDDELAFGLDASVAAGRPGHAGTSGRRGCAAGTGRTHRAHHPPEWLERTVRSPPHGISTRSWG
jgi:hypothetical protein